MTWDQLLASSVVVLLLGMWLGTKFTDKKWRDNAQDYRRIESGGKIYKVTEQR